RGQRARLLTRQVRRVCIDHHATLLHHNRVRLDAGSRVNETAASRDVELPEMPGTAYDLAIALDGVVGRVKGTPRGWGFGNDAPVYVPRTQRALFMGADIAQRVVASIDVEHADPGATPERYEELAPAGRDLRLRADDHTLDLVRVIVAHYHSGSVRG